jgi:hypothetical protein
MFRDGLLTPTSESEAAPSSDNIRLASFPASGVGDGFTVGATAFLSNVPPSPCRLGDYPRP